MKKNPKEIIVRMPNWIGDLVMAIPVLIDLKRAFPRARLTAMCKRPLAEILEQESYIDEVYSFSKTEALSRRDEDRDVIQHIRRGNYDLGVLLPNSFSSAWLFWRGQVQERVGYAGHLRSWLLSKVVKLPQNAREQHLVKTYKQLLTSIGIPISNTKPSLTIIESEKRDALELLKRYGVQGSVPLVGINPGAAYGSAKCWPLERYREVTEKILTFHPDLHVIYFGDEAGSALTKEICRNFDHRVINLAGQTSLRSLMSLLHLLDVFLTNDSGPMHIAAALNIPLVALFGSTDATVTGPYQSGKVIHKHVSCSPCFKRTCPIDFRCMKAIETREVAKEVYQLIKLTWKKHA